MLPRGPAWKQHRRTAHISFGSTPEPSADCSRPTERWGLLPPLGCCSGCSSPKRGRTDQLVARPAGSHLPCSSHIFIGVGGGLRKRLLPLEEIQSPADTTHELPFISLFVSVQPRHPAHAAAPRVQASPALHQQFSVPLLHAHSPPALLLRNAPHP